MRKTIYHIIAHLVLLGWSAVGYAAGIKGSIDLNYMPEIGVDWRVLQVSRNRGYGTIFFRGSKGSADFTQSLSAGETIVFERTGDTFTGPATVTTDVSYQNVILGFNYTMNINEHFGTVFGAYARQLQQLLTTTDGTNTVKYDQTMVGPISLSIGGVYRPREWLLVEGGWSTYISIFESLFGKDYINSLNDTHIRVSIVQNKNIQYFLGYRAMNYAYADYQASNDPAAIHIDYSGMYGGLSIQF